MHPNKPTPLKASKAPPLKGPAQVPGDKSISQRALILGAMASGETAISGLLESEDVLNTAASLRALGAEVTRQGSEARGGNWRVRGARWKSPAAPLDFGNSGTGSRLVMGAVAGQNLTAIFTGDASLRSRPMARVLEPLKAFGASYQGQGPKALMPVTLTGAKDARAIETQVTVASAQVKSALLLAALHARGTSRIGQATLTRDHTEKMLAAFGANISVTPSESGEMVSLEGRTGLKATSVEVPRDPSSAAFAMVAALIVPGSAINLPAILLNPRRTGLIETLLEMGADISIQNRRVSGGEEIGDLTVRHSRLKGVTVPAARAPSMIDEYPILSVAAAFADGKTLMMGLEELRVKESDRLEAIIAGLHGNRVHAFESENNLTVEGSAKVAGGGLVATHMDHRIAMSFLTLGLASEKPVMVDDVSMIATSFPEYQDLMRGLGAVMETP
jgi:3-phosphoshikimate 1-carboxyvinyltransferase